jgi:Protein of unknown function (DUF1569)
MPQQFATCGLKEMSMPVDTARVHGRRKLDYSSLEEVLADADRLSSAPVRALGNWSAGQIFRHLATVYSGSIDGITMTMPWILRMMARLFKKKLINGPMLPGFKLPAEAAKVLAPEPTSAEEGLAELHAAVSRLEREPHRAKHPVFGDLSREEWNQIHLKHASLHMSFLVPLS